jgi:hypothetical protein
VLLDRSSRLRLVRLCHAVGSAPVRLFVSRSNICNSKGAVMSQALLDDLCVNCVLLDKTLTVKILNGCNMATQLACGMIS